MKVFFLVTFVAFIFTTTAQITSTTTAQITACVDIPDPDTPTGIQTQANCVENSPIDGGLCCSCEIDTGEEGGICIEESSGDRVCVEAYCPTTTTSAPMTTGTTGDVSAESTSTPMTTTTTTTTGSTSTPMTTGSTDVFPSEFSSTEIGMTTTWDKSESKAWEKSREWNKSKGKKGNKSKGKKGKKSKGKKGKKKKKKYKYGYDNAQSAKDVSDVGYQSENVSENGPKYTVFVVIGIVFCLVIIGGMIAVWKCNKRSKAGHVSVSEDYSGDECMEGNGETEMFGKEQNVTLEA